MILIAFCLGTMTGCGLLGNKGDETIDSIESSAGEGSDVETGELTEESATLNDSDTLGEYDFDGAKYNVLSRESTIREWDHNNNEHGTTVANAVYTRNQLVQQRLNVKIVVDEIGGWWNNDWGKSPWFAKYQTVTQSGWSEYSIITGHFSLAQAAALRGFCMDMTTLNAIDVEKEWWSEKFYERCNLNAYSGAMGTPHVFSATDSMFGGNSQGYASYYATRLSQYTSNLAAFYKAYGIVVD